MTSTLSDFDAYVQHPLEQEGKDLTYIALMCTD